MAMGLEPTKLRNMSSAELDKEEEQLREGIWKLRLQVNVRVDCTCADGDAYGLAGQIYGLISRD